MKYKILTNKNYREPVEISIDRLEKQVREYIKEGWRTEGGVAMSRDPYGQTIMQVMVKDDNVVVSVDPPAKKTLAKKTPVRKKAKTATEIAKEVAERNKSE